MNTWCRTLNLQNVLSCNIAPKIRRSFLSTCNSSDDPLKYRRIPYTVISLETSVLLQFCIMGFKTLDSSAFNWVKVFFPFPPNIIQLFFRSEKSILMKIEVIRIFSPIVSYRIVLLRTCLYLRRLLIVALLHVTRNSFNTNI